MPVTHSFVSTKDDSDDTSVVRPSDWNAAHVIDVDLTSEVSGTLPISNGGTGQATANAALNALLPDQSSNSGKFLKTDGTNTSWANAAPAIGFTDGQILIGKTDGTLTIGNLGAGTGISVNEGDGTLQVSTDSTSSPEFSGLTLSGATANRLTYFDGLKSLSSLSTLSIFIKGTTNQISIADNGVGGVNISTPQDIGTTSSPTFATAYISSASQGGLFFSGSSNELSTDATKLFYNNTTVRLGLGLSLPTEKIHIRETESNNYLLVEAGGNSSNYSGLILSENATYFGHHIRFSAATDRMEFGVQDGTPTFSTHTEIDYSGNWTYDGTLVCNSNVRLPSIGTERIVATDVSGNITDIDLDSYISGTVNQITVTDNLTGGVSLSTPQDISTTSSPTFATSYISSATAGGVFFAGAAKQLSTDATRFYYNSIYARLALGFDSPTEKIHIRNTGANNYLMVEAGGSSSNYSGLILSEDRTYFGHHIRFSAATDRLEFGVQDGTPTFSTHTEIDYSGNWTHDGAITLNGGASGASPSPQLSFSNYIDNSGNPSVSHLKLYSDVGFGVSTSHVNFITDRTYRITNTSFTPIMEMTTSGTFLLNNPAGSAYTFNLRGSMHIGSAYDGSLYGTYMVTEPLVRYNNRFHYAAVAAGTEIIGFGYADGSASWKIGRQSTADLRGLWNDTGNNFAINMQPNTGGTNCFQFVNTSDPSGTPVGGGVIYSSSGAIKGKGTSGTVTTIAAADPHCEICGRDYALEWTNDKYGSKLTICVACWVNDIGNKPYIKWNKLNDNFDNENWIETKQNRGVVENVA